MMSGIASLVETLVIFLGPFLFLVLLIWVPWNRYLHHKEALLLLQKGGEETGGAWYALLEMRERWRLRWGLLTGAAMTVLGIAILVSIPVWMQLVAMRRAQMPRPRLDVVDIRSVATLAALSVFLMIMGLITLITHAVWARKRTPKATENEPEQKA